jgi:hypothetical protein
MPGWIIQGVRGEGKSLAAVGKIKEYMLKGRPVATNLNLFLDNFLPADCASMAYRLPDHPRLEDFQMLPPAYDTKYKGEDKNGLLVLDELGTWLNARNWNDKKRLEMLNWLFLSRKDHWDLILLAQDHEMIDAQVRTTLCDYLVQASRLDRQKIPYLAPALKMLGLNSMMPRVHRYHVFYGLSQQTPPVETWSFTGKDFYTGYDTNQKFLNGQEALNGTLIDMRATYSFIPANYLSRHVFIERLHKQVERLKNLKPLKTESEGEQVAKKGVGSEANYFKIGFLVVALVGFLGWRFFSGGFAVPVPTVQASVLPVPVPITSTVKDEIVKPVVNNSQMDIPDRVALETSDFMDYLLQHFRPRLSVSAYSPEGGFYGNIDFYDKAQMVERYPISALHALGVALIHRPYGADLIYKDKSFIVTAWKLPTLNQASIVPEISPENLQLSQK